MNKWHLFSSVLLSLSVTHLSHAKDLGRLGVTFPIGEIDMLEWIQNRLKSFEANGKMDEMKEEFTAKVKERVENPVPVGLTTTTAPTSFFVSAEMTIGKDIIDPNTGTVLARRGMVINPFDPNTWPMTSKERPLAQMGFSKELVFFDASDPQQMTWAQSHTSDKPIKWILTGGSPNKASEILGHKMYFAQDGNITRKLNIKHVPSKVAQSGTQWKVTEYDVSNLASYEEDEQ